MKKTLRTSRSGKAALLAALAAACWLDAHGAATEPAGPPLLTTVRQLRQLSHAEARQQPPVRLRGVVTFHEPAWYLSFLQDSTGGIYVKNFDPAVRPGMEVEVEGVASLGQARTSVIIDGSDATNQARLRVLGPGRWPEALPLTAEEIRSEAHGGRWTSIRGVVVGMERAQDGVMIEVDVEGQPLRVAVPRWPQNWSLPGYLRGHPVTIRGVPGRAWRREDGVVRGTLYTWSIQEIEVDPETLARLFDRPVRGYRDLFEFDLRDSPLVRIRGRVSFHQPGQGFFVLLDEERRVWVQTSAPGQLHSGDFVDVVGRRDRFEGRPLLTDGYYRVEQPGAPEPPWSRQASQVRDEPGRSHGALIDIEGRLVEQFSSLSEDSLVLEDGGVAFLARLRRTEHSRLPALAADTRLRLRGTCLSRRMPLVDSLPPSFVFQLWLEKPADVAVVRLPPWWTKRRLLWLCGAILFAGLLAGTWVLVLRQQVARQSEIIGHQREREAVSRERARIARELHDSLGQELVGISLQLDSAAARLAEAPEQAGPALDLARTMIRHSQAEAKRSVWNLRAENLDGVDLPSALERALQPMVAPPGSPQLRVNVEGAHRRLPGVLEHHLLRIGQEAVTNVVRHARAAHIQVDLRYGERDVTLEVRDDGCGFDAAEALGLASGHFGLLGLRERANKLQGRLHIQSRPGAGTTVSVEAPYDPIGNA